MQNYTKKFNELDKTKADIAVAKATGQPVPKGSPKTDMAKTTAKRGALLVLSTAAWVGAGKLFTMFTGIKPLWSPI